MINSYFNEQINKNNVLLDESNLLDIYCLNKFDGCKSFKITSLKKYGYIFLSVKGVLGEMFLSYNGINLKTITKDGEFFIPINFVLGESLELVGTCDSLVLKLYGGKIEYKKLCNLMPLNKCLVMGINNSVICSYSNIGSILSNEYDNNDNLGTNVFVQTFIKNSIVGFGKLKYINGLEFSNSFDNYEEKIIITDKKITDAVFVQKYSTDEIMFIYLCQNKLFYRRYNLITRVFSEEKVIGISGLVLGLVASSVNAFDSKLFGVVTTVGVSMYIIKSSFQIEKVFKGKIENLRIFEYDNSVSLLIFDNYSTRLMEFDLDTTKSGSGVLKYKNSKIYSNVIDVLELENMHIYTSVCGDKYVCEK